RQRAVLQERELRSRHRPAARDRTRPNPPQKPTHQRRRRTLQRKPEIRTTISPRHPRWARTASTPRFLPLGIQRRPPPRIPQLRPPRRRLPSRNPQTKPSNSGLKNLTRDITATTTN